MKTDIFSYNQFVDDLKNKEVVFFFGAGITNSLTKKRLGWKEWIQKGIDGIKDVNIVKGLNDRLVKSSTAEDLMNIVSDVVDIKKRDHTYSIWMKESFEQIEIVDLELVNTLKLLTISNDVFVTTNYDLLLEKATGLGSLSYVDTDKSFRMIDSRRNDSVIHIHGIYDSSNNIDNIIATKEQYENILIDKGAQFIQNTIGTRVIIFIGCGKTTEDVNINQFIEFASKYLKMDVDYYYLSNSNCHIEGLPNNIHLINYGDEYDDLEPFLKDLAIERVKNKTKENRVVGINILDDVECQDDSLLRYHFSQKCIPFCGRDNELVRLHSFITDNRKELWWAITGQAGAGKSRLALELIERLPPSWFGFFFNDKASKDDIDNYQPFCDTLVVIDYVAGKELEVFDYINVFLDVFKNTNYKIRILLLERENNKETGTWYSKLLNRGTTFQKEYLVSIEYHRNFLYLEDLNTESIKSFIHHVCHINQYDSNDEEDTMLLNEYASKFERLRFRPLYVQLFVESWIGNHFLLPSYDDYTSLIEELLRREQNKWLESLDNDVEVCNACIRILVRANISPIYFDKIPELYKGDWMLIEEYVSSHSLPGKQKYEFGNVLIRSLCQNIDHDNEIVAPQFPDLIKEYMFYYYTDKKKLGDVMKEIWENASYHYSIFIRRCMMDFQSISFFTDSLSAYDKITSNIDALNGRLDLLDNVKVKKGDNPFIYFSLINNEYQFWMSLPMPPKNDKNEDLIASLKITGLFKVASNVGGWVIKDATPVTRVAKDIYDVNGGETSQALKKLALTKIATNLAESSYINESNYISGLLDSLDVVKNDGFDSYVAMSNKNNLMINELVSKNEDKALKVFNEAISYIDFNSIETCRLGATLCFRYLSASREFELSYQPIPLIKVKELSSLYPDDAFITLRKIACETIEVEYRCFPNDLEDESLGDNLTALENKLVFNKAYSNEELDAYADAFARISTLWLNIGSKEKIEAIISNCNSILSQNKRLAVIVYTLNTAMLCLYEEHLMTVVPVDVINNLYKYVEANSDSETAILSFFTLLNESEKKGQEEDYLNEAIMATLNHNIDYGPRNYDARNSNEGTYRRINRKIGANEPCPCGSGKKFKKCCRGNGKYD